MASNSKYVFLNGSNFLDLNLDYPSLTLNGQGLQIVGTSDIDRVFVRPGTSVDFVQSGGGADKLYLGGNLADYTYTVVGTTIELTRGSGASAETARVSGSGTDVLVFADGSVSAYSLHAFAVATAPGSTISPSTPTLPVPSGETSLAPVLPASYTSSAKVVAYTATTFAPVAPGIEVKLVGSADVDKVYVTAGSKVDASSLGGSQDLIYFTGTWADYAKSSVGTQRVFERDIGGNHETVRVSLGTAGNHDLLIFADGAVGSYTAGVAIAQAINGGVAIPPITSISDYDPLTYTPGTGPRAPTLSLAPLEDAFVNAAEGGVGVEVSYANMHVGDTIQIKDGSTDVGVAHTVDATEAAAGKVVLTVTKASLGADGVKHLVAGVSNVGGSATSAELLVTLDTAPPAPPALAVVHANANADTALDPAGAVTFVAEAGSTVQVVFTSGSQSITKQFTGTGASQAVVLGAADLAGFTDGSIAVRAQATDHAGNVSVAGTTSFMLDTVAPLAPALTVASPYQSAATATAAAGAITVRSESGSTVEVTFVNGAQSIVRTFTATGAVQAVSLSAADLATLGDGTITVRASATDVALNHSVIGGINFVLDTIAPSAPVIAIVAYDDVINASELGDVITGSTDSGSTVSLRIGSSTVAVAAVVSNNIWRYRLQPADSAFLAQGVTSIEAISTDRAGNASPATVHYVIVDTVAPHVTLVERATTVGVDSVGNTNTQGTLDFVVTFDDTAISNATSVANWQATLNGSAVAGAVTGVQSLGSGRYRISVDASRVGAADGVLTVALAPANTVLDAAGNAAVITASGTSLQGYVIDHVNEAPTFATPTRTITIAENMSTSTVVFLGGAVDADTTAPNNVVTYSLAGQDAALFDMNTTTGAVTFKASPDFETAASGGHFQLTVVATDGGGRSALQSVTVDLTDVNEAPVVGSVIGNQIAGVGNAFSFAVPASSFVDPDSVASGPNHVLTYAASLVGGGALPAWLHFDAATATFSGTAPTSTHVDVTVTATDGAAVPVSASQSFSIDAVTAVTLSTQLNGVTDLDVTSPIVVSATEAVTAVAGKYIHVVDNGGIGGALGYGGENTIHTQDILVTDTNQVQIVGNKIVINPTFDLDLSSNYSITIDDGAFLGVSSHLASGAVAGSAVSFDTVTPGVGLTTASASASHAMDATTGLLQSSYSWWNVEGVGTTFAKVDADLSTGKIALVFKDWNVAGGDAVAQLDGVGVNQSFWVDATRFGSDDLIYIDDQSNNALQANLLAWTAVDHAGVQPVRLAFDPAPGIGSDGQAWIDVRLDATTSVFSTIASMQDLLHATTSPVISG
ncbi:hypothetical protein BH09PSE5_BH09PSE5_39910 [soil metagenome]